MGRLWGARSFPAPQGLFWAETGCAEAPQGREILAELSTNPELFTEETGGEMGMRKKYWATAKRDGVADGVRSNACISAEGKLVRTWYFFCQNGKKNLVFGLLRGLQSKLQNSSNSLQSHWNMLV